MTQTETQTSDFASLVFEDKRDGYGIFARKFFPNGYGVSVIQGKYTYGGPEGLYELAVLDGDEDDWKLTYETPVTSDVEGHQSPDEISGLMAQVAALPAKAVQS